MPKPIIIGVDIRDLRVAKTGTKTYLEELCREFKSLESKEVQFKFLDVSIPVYTGNNKLLKWVEHFRYQFWKQVMLPLKAWLNRCDVLFCTDNFVPVIHLGYQTIPVFHDAFFYENPEHYGKVWLWLYKKTALPAARNAAYIVTPTLYSKKQINYYTQLPLGKIAIIPEGPKTLKVINDNDPSLLNKFGLKPKKYLLHVGSMFKRKNIPSLIKAFDQVRKEGFADLKLVLAGSPPAAALSNDYAEILVAIAQTGLKDSVVFTGYLTDGKLALLYSHALLYVFPSVNEGFGIPILEAFKHNLPVLVANNTCLPEVGGDAVITFDPFSIDDISNQVTDVLKNQHLQLEMIRKGQERLQYFSWKLAAEQLIELFKKAV